MLQASDLLIADFPSVFPTDSLHKAVDIFIDHHLQHIPIVDNARVLMGMLPIDMIIDHTNKATTIEECKEDWIYTQVTLHQHLLSIFELTSRYELSAVPVTDVNRTYLGVIPTYRLLSKFSQFYSISTPGGIIVLRVGVRDLDLSEIARIIESNNAKILLLYMDAIDGGSFLEVTIKVNTLDLRFIIATLERYEYHVPFYQPSDSQEDPLKERYDLLMKMFDI
ncbi:MAG: CBS domain-containing protein [Bacteroidota bacterium]|nr:CBS domain-containing protein [Bacteroidota bacterium]